MKYHILTLFPEMIEQGLHTSILGRAINNGYISLETTNIRDFSANKFNRVDLKKTYKRQKNTQRQIPFAV